MLDPDFKQKWLQALRSGEYQQGRFALHDATNNAHCCLGVAADLILQESDREMHIYDTEVYEGALGLDAEEIQTLITLNDDEKKSFEQIADYIEATF